MSKTKKVKEETIVEETIVEETTEPARPDLIVHGNEPMPVETSENPMTKEEFCKEYDIERLGSNHAQTEYAKYLASIA